MKYVVLDTSSKPMVVSDLVSINDICRVILKDKQSKKFFGWDSTRATIVMFFDTECKDIGDVVTARCLISQHISHGWTCHYYDNSAELAMAR